MAQLLQAGQRRAVTLFYSAVRFAQERGARVLIVGGPALHLWIVVWILVIVLALITH